MGQNNSAPLGGRRKSFRDSWRFPHRSHTRKGNLSATFNIIDTDTRLEQLNVNTASEEELMTLPGISRIDAHSIVEYRQRIGRFKKVEDLALVSGIGADKLALLRPEICVGIRRSLSCTSSRAQSFDSIPSVELKSHCHSPPPLNVNTATVFDLQALPGFTQEIAANVVDYRDRHGWFTNLDSLTKVKGINNMRLGTVRSRLCLHTEPVQTLTRNGFPPSQSVSHSTPKCTHKMPAVVSTQANGKPAGYRNTMSAPIKYSVPNGLAVRDILDVLSACSQRPIVEDHFDGKRKGRPAVRLVSWNLSGLSLDKAENPGVREVLCRTILENRFSLVAVQEVIEIAGLKQLCEELNFPTLRRVKEWKENSKAWHYKSSNGLGFLWDSSDDISVTSMNIVQSHPCEEDSSATLHATIKVGNLSVSLINIHIENLLQCRGSGEVETSKQLQSYLTKESEIVIILGDLSGFEASNKDQDKTLWETNRFILPQNTSTNSILPGHHPPETSYTDNIILNKNAQNQFTEMSGVVRQGLTHLAIPRGWSWGGPASEHCPVWCEIYTNKIPQSSNSTKKG